MARVLLVLAVVAAAFIVVSLVDCAVQPATRHRGVPKAVWIIVIIVLPVIGALLWFVIGRGPAPDATPVAGADDDLSFLSGIDLSGFSVDGSAADAAAERASRDERIRRLEAELARLDEEERRGAGSASGGSGSSSGGLGSGAGGSGSGSGGSGSGSRGGTLEAERPDDAGHRRNDDTPGAA